MTEELLSRESRRGRITLLAVTIGSGVAILDGTVVNIALRAIGTSLHAGLAELQWVVNGYLLALASLILVGGSLGDRFGRRRVYVIGVAGFTIMSVACALAQTPGQLILARVLQGVFSALLTPGGLAIIQSSFRPEDRSAAIGWWAGVSGTTTALGPFVGGFLLDHGGWRWVFLINVPLCLVVLLLCRWVPESKAEQTSSFDVRGATLAAVGLGLVTFALTGGGTSTAVLVGAGVLGVALLVGFVIVERLPGAMVPVQLFASRLFSAANSMTFLVYGAMGAVFLFLVLQLQVTSGYTPLEAGLATLPVTIAMLFLSSRSAVLAHRIGPRIQMSVGPILCAIGVLLLSSIGPDAPFWSAVLPGMTVFALGLASLVSPLTASVLAAVPDRFAGIASGVNNAVARTGSLIAVAALPMIVGLSGTEYQDPVALTSAYRHGLWICAGALALGGVISWWGVPARADSPS